MQLLPFTFQKIVCVHNNPVVAGRVSEADHYLHNSSRDYSGIKGVLDVEILENPYVSVVMCLVIKGCRVKGTSCKLAPTGIENVVSPLDRLRRK